MSYTVLSQQMTLMQHMWNVSAVVERRHTILCIIAAEWETHQKVFNHY
jgi:hypothetical protein